MSLCFVFDVCAVYMYTKCKLETNVNGMMGAYDALFGKSQQAAAKCMKVIFFFDER